jgi:hypothetical protein
MLMHVVHADASKNVAWLLKDGPLLYLVLELALNRKEANKGE